jgi:hypothetical protein
LTAEQLQTGIAALEPRALVNRIWTFDEEAGRALSQNLLAWLGSVFGAFALLLLMIGPMTRSRRP